MKRPVWLDDADLEWDGAKDDEENLWRIYQLACRLHAAAPADATEAARDALLALGCQSAPGWADREARAVLASLGDPGQS